MMADSAMFQNGVVTDKRFSWHPNGYVSDSISRLNDSVYIHVGWFDDGKPAFAGYELNDKRNGKWTFYHHNGQLSASAVYSKGNIISIEYFDEAGKTQTDTSAVNREAMVKGGEAAWRKYLEKNLYWPPGLKFTTPAAVTVGISFVVDENGKVIDAEVSMPFHEEFDRIALKIIKNSPAWLPAIAYNRKVKAYRRQPITFTQSD
jgi:TonB family protein